MTGKYRKVYLDGGNLKKEYHDTLESACGEKPREGVLHVWTDDRLVFEGSYYKGIPRKETYFGEA